MAVPKAKSLYRCTECGTTSPRWSGQCAGCGQWNTLEEAVAPSAQAANRARAVATPQVVASAALLANKPLTRLNTGMPELDRALGGGVVPGSFLLLGGEPGIGKSTLTLQLAAQFAARYGKVLLVSGEESAEQIALRATRTGAAAEWLHIAALTDTDEIVATAEAENPVLLIVDSAQVMSSAQLPSSTGSTPQVRYLAEQLLRYAKTSRVPVVLIGHVTKDGDLAGPRVLSHLVDAVLQLEGDAHRDIRLLRASKNRFGATSEVGVFQMTGEGLTDVANPSELFLEGRSTDAVGSCITATVEGTRPLLIEVQALTAPTVFGYPKRTSSGFSLNRLNLLIAVLERHAGVKLDSNDVYVNIVGGATLNEPAADLAVCLAIASSKLKIPLPQKLAAWGEVGLTGEVRAVSQSQMRMKEAKNLGYTQMVDVGRLRTIGGVLEGKRGKEK